MWVKILAGVGAALVVVSVGVFLAVPPGGWSQCGKCDSTPAPSNASADDDEGCCGECCQGVATETTPACCAEGTPAPGFGTGLAACLGGAVTQPEQPQPQTSSRMGPKVGHSVD